MKTFTMDEMEKILRDRIRDIEARIVHNPGLRNELEQRIIELESLILELHLLEI